MLIWKDQVNELSKKLCKTIFLVRNLKPIVGLNTILNCYHGYFQSALSYAIFTWGHSSHAKDIFALQRRCIRIIANLSYQEPCQSAFVSLKILTLPCIYILQCLSYVKRYENRFVKHSNVHIHLTRNRENLQLNDLRLTRSRNAENYHCIKFYNALPRSIKMLQANLFYKKMKSYLITKAFYSFEDYLHNDFSDFIS
ncbi:unnamed protein product [Callosobruchus maculatus]|uniref:RNA-directed DNA polymerase n=1 Tax=Callosobruchus maculatus TaxID=64391 RepID=A0A653D995_CALMS|nr:unnamed protein product [Callosobruchus maculatus]